MTNRERAEAGELALRAFTRQTYGGRNWNDLDPDDQRAAVADLICDLMHTCRFAGFLEPDGDMTTQAFWNWAISHYEVEVVEDEDGYDTRFRPGASDNL